MRRGPHAFSSGRFLTALGATLEWYDFALYLYLAPVIGGLFFPSGDALSSLLATFGVFAVSYLVRPVGALFFGQFGDRRGRRAALITSVSLMTVPMVLLGALPTYATIGVAAPIALIVVRLVQGFSVGGEFSGTLVLMNESAEARRRGFVAAFSQSAAGLGLLLASGVAALLHAILSTPAMDDFGWRIGFFAGAGIGVVALIMRLKMAETAAFAAVTAAGGRVSHPTRETLSLHKRQVLLVVALTGYAGIAGYMVATWLPSFLQTVIHAGASESLLATTIGGLFHVVLCPLAGRVSDRFGRRSVMLSGAAGMALLAYPLFVLVAATEFWRIVAGTLGLMLFATWYLGPVSAAIAELFPTATRFSGVSIGYNVATAVFAGTTPLLATALITWTGWDLAPSVYLIVTSVLILLLLWRVRETARVDLERVGDAAAGRPATASS